MELENPGYCPFCGSNDVISLKALIKIIPHPEEYIITCRDCDNQCHVLFAKEEEE